MNNGILVASNHPIHTRHTGVRRASAAAALAIILSLFILVQEPADAAPGGSAPAAAVALPGIGDGASPQFAQIVCPILLQFRATFANQPFFAVGVPIIDQLLISFGCIPGPTTTTTLAPTTTTTVAPTTTTTTTIVLPPIPGFNFGQITCPILLSLRGSFVNSPFFAGFLPIIDQLIVNFGCAVSG